MTKYVALLRGIAPLNPAMSNASVKKFLEDLGFENVIPVISSGNYIFESNSKDQKALEEKIEKALPKKLGFSSTTIIRSKSQLEALVKKDPFKGIVDERPNYLIVTFFKDKTPELATVVDLDKNNGGQFMAKLDKEHGKQITTRTWKTVHRILKRMESFEKNGEF